MSLTDHAKDGGKDAVEEAVGVVAKGADASGLLSRDEGIRTGRVLLKGWGGRIDVATAVKLDIVSLVGHKWSSQAQLTRCWRRL